MRAARRFTLCLVTASALVAAHAGTAAAQDDDARYQLANGCYALRSQATGQFAAKHADGGYRASAASPGEAEPFRMKATRLGSYMLNGRAGDFLAKGDEDPGDAVAGAAANRVEPAAEPGPAADWRVTVEGPGTFRIELPSENKVLAVGGGARNELVLAEAGAPGTVFSFQVAEGCAAFPEVEVNATGTPRRGTTTFGEVRGLVDAHIHGMAFEFLGGSVHCGRPWSPYGVTVALVDCPDHFGNGAGAVLENTVSYKNPARTHDPVGWPTFRDWPAAKSLTHEQTYYKWLERSWRGGLRIWVNLLVDNAVLCEAYPLKRNSCNEMDGVRLQARRLYEFQDYIDAQSGGPGKGWFRIVKDPFEARRVINDGKLAVVMGIEVSKLFDCGVQNDQPECDKRLIDRQLDEVYKLGVRDMELVNKFDNALTGVAGDAGDTGVVVNNGNRYETGEYWNMQHCDGANGAEDKPQHTGPGTGRDELVGGIIHAFLPMGTTPVYDRPPHCNQRGLTDLGEYLVRRMMAKRMIVDPDHMSVRGRNHLLSIVESKRYSGIVSSHSWSSPDAIPRIYRLGGFVTPYAGDSTSFVKTWREWRPTRDPRYFFGFGYGADMNGFGAQGDPRGANVPNPVRYPFKSFDGKVTLDKQRSGERVYDINVDGVAHYGLYPDWVEDLRVLAGQQIVKDMARGSEAYLQMWERAEGVARRRCQPARSDVNRRGIGHVRLGRRPAQVLFRAGQPRSRPGRVFRYCVNRRGPRPKGVLRAVFTRRGQSAFVFSTAPGHRMNDFGRGTRPPRAGRRLGRNLVVLGAGKGRRFVFGVRGGKVRFVAVGTRAATKNRKVLRRYLRLAS